MNGENSGNELRISVDDLVNCGWQDAIAQTRRKGYSAIWQALSDAANEATASDEKIKGQALTLLNAACSMKLRPESLNKPFGPNFVIDGYRSSLPEDFSEWEIELFSQVAGQIDDLWIKARLADLVWLCGEPRDPIFALMAIDTYRQLPLEEEIWMAGASDCWDRAIRLAVMLGNGAGDRLSEMERALCDALKLTTKENRYFVTDLAETLYRHRLGKEDTKEIADRLERLGQAFHDDGDMLTARDFLAHSVKWFNRLKESDREIEVTIKMAECLVAEAEAKITPEGGSHAVAMSYFEEAIQVYRSIPRAARSRYGVEERISELRHRLADSGKRSLEEMVTMKTEGADITDLVEQSQDAVRGKPVNDAMAAFITLNHFGFEKIREQAKESINNQPLQSLFSTRAISHDGRVIAKQAGMNLGSSNEDDSAIWLAMLRYYKLGVGLVVKSSILPALEVMTLEHRLTEADFIRVAFHSPIVPNDRAALVGKGLFAGYDYDFVTACHLLTPQIENMVRFHLKNFGVHTTHLDQNGIDTEKGLSALMQEEDADRVFGDDLAFELRALYCDSHGPNLRNEIAHGLISFAGCQSQNTIYAWWHTLKLVFAAYWRAHHQQAQAEPVDEDSDGAESDKSGE